MIPSAQRRLKELGEYGCYFLSLCKVAEEMQGFTLDVLQEYSNARDRGLFDAEGCIKDGGAVFSFVSHAPIAYTVIKAGNGHPLPLDYKLQPGEREILRFEYVDAGGKTWAHFVVGDGNQKCAYDPEGDSQSVARGKVVSRRIIRRL